MASAKARPLLTADPATPIDSELKQLMHDFPEYTQVYLHNLMNSKDQVERSKNQRRTKLFASEQSRLPQSDYKSTYYPKEAKPRSSKRPLRTPPVHNEADPSSFVTAYKSEYKPLDLNCKMALMKRDGSSEFAIGGRATSVPPVVSAYKENFVAIDISKAPLPQDLQQRPKTHLQIPMRKFEGITTNQLHFPQPISVPGHGPFTFAELPSFAGSVLYPSNKFETQKSTTQAAYQPHHGASRVELSKKPADSANFKPEGQMESMTVHRSTFKPLSLDERLPKAVPPRSEIQLKSNDLNLYRTQSMDDFQYRPCDPTLPVTPARSHINLRYDNNCRSTFETEQRSQFRGIDTSVHQPSKPIRQDLKVMQTGLNDKFDDSTCNKLTYHSHDLAVAHSAPVAAKADASHLITVDPKFFSSTTSKEHFRDWSHYVNKERYRHGDFTEALKAFIKSATAEPPAKFETETTFKRSFVPLPLEQVQKAVPLKGSINLEGDREFGTVYRSAFAEPKPRLSGDDLSKLKDYLLNVKTATSNMARNQPKMTKAK